MKGTASARNPDYCVLLQSMVLAGRQNFDDCPQELLESDCFARTATMACGMACAVSMESNDFDPHRLSVT